MRLGLKKWKDFMWMCLVGVFAKVQKAPISFIVSVCQCVCLLAVCIEQIGSHWMDFVKFGIWLLFKNPSRKFGFHYNLTRITRALHQDLRTCMITVSGKHCREIQNTFYYVR
jgi:hypothetical protein